MTTIVVCTMKSDGFIKAVASIPPKRFTLKGGALRAIRHAIACQLHPEEADTYEIFWNKLNGNVEFSIEINPQRSSESMIKALVDFERALGLAACTDGFNVVNHSQVLH